MLQYLQDILPLAITNTIIKSIVFSFVIWLVVMAISKNSAVSSHTRYALSVSGAIVSLIIFCALLWQQIMMSNQSGNGSYYAEASTNPFPIQNTSLVNLIIQIPIILAPYISLLYVSMLLIKCYQLLSRYYNQKHLLLGGNHKAPIDIRLLVQHYSTVLGIKRPIRVITNYATSIPFTTGFFKPIIYLPIASINQLRPEEVEAILIHELVHIMRQDYFINLVLEVTSALLFFNPFTRMMINDARIWREISCDDIVLQFKIVPKSYAQALMYCGMSNKSTLSLAATGSSSFHLLNRIKRIMEERQAIKESKPRLLILPAIISFLLILGIAVGTTYDSGMNISSNPKPQDFAKDNNMRLTSLSTWLGNKLPIYDQRMASSSPDPVTLSPLTYYMSAGWDIYADKFDASSSSSIDQNDAVVKSKENDVNINSNATIQVPEINTSDTRIKVAFTEPKNSSQSHFTFVAYDSMPKEKITKEPTVIVKNRGENRLEQSNLFVSNEPVIKGTVEWAEDIKIVLSENQKEKLISNQEEYLLLALSALDEEIKNIEKQINKYSFEEIKAIEIRLADQMKKIEDKATRMLQMRNKILVDNNIDDQNESIIDRQPKPKTRKQLLENLKEEFQLNIDINNMENENSTNKLKLPKGKIIIAVTL